MISLNSMIECFIVKLSTNLVKTEFTCNGLVNSFLMMHVLSLSIEHAFVLDLYCTFMALI